jgi:hypothetical protein
MAKKTNHPETTLLRKDRPVKAEKVRAARSIEGRAVRAARKQNETDGGPNLAVIPTTAK